MGYDVQAAVDAKHYLFVAHDVTNVESDCAQLARMASRARRTMGNTMRAGRGEVAEVISSSTCGSTDMLAARLGAFAAQLSMARVPGSVRHAARLRILNTMGAGLAGVEWATTSRWRRCSSPAARRFARDGTQANVLDLMQTRAELYERIDYDRYEHKLDQLFAQAKASPSK